jgi:DNA-directed RNA polymerase subunit RPC12/RpoP
MVQSLCNNLNLFNSFCISDPESNSGYWFLYESVCFYIQWLACLFCSERIFSKQRQLVKNFYYSCIASCLTCYVPFYLPVSFEMFLAIFIQWLACLFCSKRIFLKQRQLVKNFIECSLQFYRMSSFSFQNYSIIFSSVIRLLFKKMKQCCWA